MSQYDDLVRKYAQQYNVPEALIRAIISVESSWNPKAYRAEPRIHDASYGLMQVLSKTAADIWSKVVSAADLFDPEFNIETGTKYIRSQLNRYQGNIPMAVSAYNAGHYTTRNQSYVDKVMNLFYKYSGTDEDKSFSLPSSGSGGDDDSPGPDGSSGSVLLIAIAVLAGAILFKKLMG